MLIALMAASSVFANGIGSIDDECQDFGFDFGVAKWECDDDDWSLDEGDANTIVTGDCEAADWNVDSTDADGIVAKGGNIEHGGFHFAVVGTSGEVDEGKDISHITFCGNDGNNHEIPEFTAIGAGISLLGAAGYALYRKRSRK